jgi:hypothetical protein
MENKLGDAREEGDKEARATLMKEAVRRRKKFSSIE